MTAALVPRVQIVLVHLLLLVPPARIDRTLHRTLDPLDTAAAPILFSEPAVYLHQSSVVLVQGSLRLTVVLPVSDQAVLL
jgi:hypothetical protein